MSSRWPGIPAPEQSLASLQATVSALKEAVELLTGQRGPVAEYSVDQMVLDLQSRNENAFGRVFEVNEAQTSATKALAQRTTIIEADLNTPTTGLQARFTGLTTATVDVTNSTSLINRMDTVEARAGEATASGSVKLSAVAGPTGATAAYELQLSSGGTSLGVQYIVTGGVGKMVFTTNVLAFRDGSTLKNVLTYSAGKFTFTSDVEINGNLIINSTVPTDAIASNAVTNIVADTQTVAGAANFDVSITTLAGSPVAFFLTVWDPTGATIQTGLVNFDGFTSVFDVKYDGLALDSIVVLHSVIGHRTSGTVGYRTMLPAFSFQGRVAAGVLAAGLHTFRVANPIGANLKMAMTLVELKR